MKRVWRGIVGFFFIFGFGVCQAAEGERQSLLDVDPALLTSENGRAQGIFATPGQTSIVPSGFPGGVRVSTPARGAVLGQIVDRPLEQMSVLTWAWRAWPVTQGTAAEEKADDLPIRLIVGFSDAPLRSGNPTAIVKEELPAHDRAVLVVWGTKAVYEGDEDSQGAYGRYVANGQMPDGQWWEQTLDLGSLHRALWPTIPLQAVRVAFVAVAGRDSTQSSQAEVMRLELAAPPSRWP